MKKYLKLVAVAIMAIVSLAFVSCEKDGGDSTGSVVGMWEITYVNAATMEGMEMDGGYKAGDTMTFYANGEWEDSTDSGTWTKSGDTLTIIIDDEYSFPIVMKITKLTSKVLEVKLDYTFFQLDMKMKKVN